jgi:hypothetical protein
MSRRTKLWIAAVFALLMTGPLVYLRLAWSPENPLRFRVVDLQAAASADPSFSQNVVFEMENTTSFPLVFLGAELGRKDMRILTMGSIRMRDQDSSLINAEGKGIELRGGQRIRVVADMNTYWHLHATEHGAKVEYYWCSAAEYWFSLRLAKVCSPLPQRFWRFIPHPSPSRDMTPLEPFGGSGGP